VSPQPLIWRWQKALRETLDLPASAKATGHCISTWANLDGTSCFPSIKAICAATGRHKSTIYRDRNLLRQNGWLKWVRTSTGRPPPGTPGCRYRFSIPETRVALSDPSDHKTADKGRTSQQEGSQEPATTYPDTYPLSEKKRFDPRKKQTRRKRYDEQVALLAEGAAMEAGADNVDAYADTVCRCLSGEPHPKHGGKCGEDQRRHLEGTLSGSGGNPAGLSDDDLRGRLRGLRSSQGGGAVQASSAEWKGYIREAFYREWSIEEIEDLTRITPRDYLLDLAANTADAGNRNGRRQ